MGSLDAAGPGEARVPPERTDPDTGSARPFVPRAIEPAEAPHRHRLVALIPVFNEAGRIGNVLKVLRGVPALGEILVVNDGSQDSTGAEAEAAAAEDPRIRVIHHPVNKGKGQAVDTGISAVTSDLILMLDGDLLDLQPHHVESLIGPVLAGSADMTVGLFRGGRWNTDFAHRITPWLSGQRCLRARLWAQVCPEAAQGYGVETALTVAARQNHWRVERVALVGVHHPPSEYHRGWLSGLRTRARMYRQVVRAYFISSRWQRQQVHEVDDLPA